MRELESGETLTSEQRRSVEQASRTAEESQGIVGQGSANRESVRKALEGRKIKGERQGAASAFLASEAETSYDPFMAIAGRPATAAAAGGSNMSSYTGATPGMNVPDTTGTAYNILNLAQNASQFNTATNTAQNPYDLQTQLAKKNAQAYGWNV